MGRPAILPVSIYSLSEHSPLRVRYIGATSQTPAARFIAHLNEAGIFERDGEWFREAYIGPTSRKVAWLRALSELPEFYVLSVMEVHAWRQSDGSWWTHGEDARLEQTWMDYARRSGHALLNEIPARGICPREPVLPPRQDPIGGLGWRRRPEPGPYRSRSTRELVAEIFAKYGIGRGRVSPENAPGAAS